MKDITIFFIATCINRTRLTPFSDLELTTISPGLQLIELRLIPPIVSNYKLPAVKLKIEEAGSSRASPVCGFTGTKIVLGNNTFGIVAIGID